MDLTKLLMENLGNGGLETLSSHVGMSKEKTSQAVTAAVPMLLGAMAKNTQGNPKGANGLLGALDRDHDGSILHDIGEFLNSSNDAGGPGILKHVLGDQRAGVEQGLSNKLGVDSGSISKLLITLAPILMGMLGKQKQQAGSAGFSMDSIGDLLSSLAGGSHQSSGLDIGDLMDMVGGMSGNSSAGSSRGGGILGGLLKGMFRR
jgi:hypothetical protein